MVWSKLWTKSEMDWLRAHYETASWPDILAALPDRTKSTIQNKVSHMRRFGCAGKRKKPPVRPKTKRPCMCCRQSFLSEGIHHRLCTLCRKKPDGSGLPDTAYKVGQL